MSRLSHGGAVAVFSAVACLAVAATAAVGGESGLAVGLAALAGALAGGEVLRDLLGSEPSTIGLLTVATLCGLGALASLPGGRWFTAAALGGVGFMNYARGVDWRVDAADEGSATASEPTAEERTAEE